VGSVGVGQIEVTDLTVPRVVVVGSNHEYAPVAMREQLAFSGDTLLEGLRQLRSQVGEGLILSTCNRTEIYAVEGEGQDARTEIFQFLSGYHSVPTSLLERASYSLTGDEAVSHMFRVASGLDSLVLGEPQILSQIRDALDHARNVGAVGPVLQRLANEALRAGKRARTDTDIARNRVSISHAAVDLAIAEMDGLEGRSALVLGAGKMATLTAKLLRAKGIDEILVVNRSIERAQELVAAVGGFVVPITGLRHAINAADLVIGAVAVDTPMVTPVDLDSRQRPLWLIDISVPRSIDPACGHLPGIHVRDVDALEPFAEETRLQYADEVSKVEILVGEAVAGFGEWARTRTAVTGIARVRAHGDAVRDQELQRALRKLHHLSPRDQRMVELLAHSLSRKLVHAPIMALRDASSDEAVDHILATLGLDDR
jgi:glutamyl-tRNA reductase